jgi:hypothetical protein
LAAYLGEEGAFLEGTHHEYGGACLRGGGQQPRFGFAKGG